MEERKWKNITRQSLGPVDAHTSETNKISVGKIDEALQYEIRDMQRYIEQGHDDGELEFSRDVAYILDDVRSDWGMRYLFENQML